ncbi:hypothetical protein PTTG_11188, partial [Puccinia triticina 1-1 BBBD Race 1]
MSSNALPLTQIASPASRSDDAVDPELLKLTQELIEAHPKEEIEKHESEDEEEEENQQEEFFFQDDESEPKEEKTQDQIYEE